MKRKIIAYEKLDETEKYLELILDEDENKIGGILNRSNLVTQLRYYLRKAIRYGLIKDETKISKIREIMSKLELGKHVYQIKQKVYNIDLNSSNEKEIVEKINDVDIETHSAKSLNLICQEDYLQMMKIGRFCFRLQLKIKFKIQQIASSR